MKLNQSGCCFWKKTNLLAWFLKYLLARDAIQSKGCYTKTLSHSFGKGTLPLA